MGFGYVSVQSSGFPNGIPPLAGGTEDAHFLDSEPARELGNACRLHIASRMRGNILIENITTHIMGVKVRFIVVSRCQRVGELDFHQYRVKLLPVR